MVLWSVKITALAMFIAAPCKDLYKKRHHLFQLRNIPLKILEKSNL